MRSDNATFAAANLSASRKPRYTVVIDFSTDGTDLVYLTSHADGANPGSLTQGVDLFAACIQTVSGTSQEIDPLKGSATIGSISIKAIDNGLTDLLSTKLAAGKGTRLKRVQVYIGFEDMAWIDYELRHTYLIQDIEYSRGVYSFQTEDIQREARKDIFIRQRYNLTTSLAADGTKVYVNTPDTTKFPTFAHDTAYTDNPAIITTACSITVAASVATFALSSGTFPAMVVGQTFTSSGFTTAGNNDDFVVTSYSTTSITAAAGSAATEAAGDTVTIAPHVGYVRLEDTKEVIRHAGMSSDGGGNYLIVSQKGALGTNSVAHDVDAGAADDRKTEVIEWSYIEGPGPYLAYNILRGNVYPSHWGLGIANAYVRQSDFEQYSDLYDTTDVTLGRQMRFEGLDKIDGKKFLEEEFMIWMGCFMPVYSTGELGFKKNARTLAGSGYVMQLDESNLVSYGALKQANSEVVNDYLINWNWVASPKLRDEAYFSRRLQLLDSDSIATHQASVQQEFSFKGVHTAAATDNDLRLSFDSLRDSYAGPPLHWSCESLPVGNVLEVGDIIRAKVGTIQDPVSGSSLDRSMQIRSVSTDWRTGRPKFKLFGSSAVPGALSRTTASTVISDAWYTSAGTNLTSVLTISADQVTTNGTVTGSATSTPTIFYYNGDLTINAGVTVTMTGNWHLYVKGFLQINGDIDCAGNGHAGGTGQTTVANNSTNGTAGVFSASAGGGITVSQLFGDGNLINTFNTSETASPNQVQGVNVIEFYETRWNGSALSPLPLDLRGSSGGGGLASIDSPEGGSASVVAAGSNGGDSGSGGVIVSRGGAFGVAGGIDLSGTNPGAQNSGTATGGIAVYGGTGAPGMPGGLIWYIDGNNTAPDLVNNVTALPGTATFNTSAFRMPVTQTLTHGPISQGMRSYYEPTIAFDSAAHSAAATRIQYVLPSATIEAEVEPAVHQIATPSAPTLATYSTEPTTVGDSGAGRGWIKVSWTASTDPNARGYQVRAKRTAEAASEYQVVYTSEDATADNFKFQVTEGVGYDVQIRVLSDQGPDGHSAYSSASSATVSASSPNIREHLARAVNTAGTSTVGSVTVGDGKVVGAAVETKAGTSVQNIKISAAGDEMEFYGDTGSGVELAATIGINTSGSDSVIGLFGTATSGNVKVAVVGLSDSGDAIKGISASGDGVVGQSTSSTGGAFSSSSGSGAICESSSSVGVQGLSTSLDGVVGVGGRYGVRGIDSGSGYGGYFDGALGPVTLVASASASAPTHSALKGTKWVTSAGIEYINTNGSTTWQKVGAQ